MEETMEKPKLLIVDDDETIRTQMKWALSSDFEISLAENRKAALQLFKSEHPSLVALDLGLPPSPHSTGEGFTALREILGENPSTKVIIITGNTEKEHALKAISLGAHDFFSKPILLDEIKITLHRAYKRHLLERENQGPQRDREGVRTKPKIVGSSSEIEKVFSDIRKVSMTDVPVLITGETGTGKELVARAIHHKSPRRNEPFVSINCAAIPETLLESELFGHEKGAFTGADNRHIGRFEKADKGTIFLDEIGELAPGLQVKLLRFLQEHKMERVGGTEVINLDTRVLCATNQNLPEAVKSGTFRDDLFYRIAVISLEVPPLRDRKGDFLLIATEFLKQFCNDLSRDLRGFSPSALEAMQNYTWPGNVRELENKIKRAVVMAEGLFIEPLHLELESLPGPHNRPTLKESKDRTEKDLVSQTLVQHNWNLSQAAKQLGVSRQALYDIIKKHGLKSESPDSSPGL